MAKLRIVAASAFAGLAFTAGAFAGGNATLQKPKGYAGPAGAVQGQVQSGAVRGAAVQARTIGKLPFTGQDLGIIAGGGMLLLLVGTSFRRFGRASGTDA